MFDKIKKNEGIKGLIAFIFTVYTIWLSVNVFTLTPMADDWRTAAAPYHNDGTWYRLLPCAIGSPFWRPFEGALGYFLGEHPALFPALNQSIVIIGHLLLICFLYYAIAKYTKHKSAALAGSAVFALSPAAVSTTSQMDGINQCWALVCGVITAYLFVRGTQTKRKFYFIGYFVMAMIATLFKENGISWFLVPVFLCILNDRIKQKKSIYLIAQNYFGKVCLGVVGSILYFVIRFVAQGSITLGGSGRYAVHPSLLDIIINNVIILGSSFTTIDSLALFMKPNWWMMLVITTIGTVLFWVYLVQGSRKLGREIGYSVFVLYLVAVLYLNLPLTIMPHVSEMSAYQAIFMFALLVGYVWQYISFTKLAKISIGIFFVCMMLSSIHKFNVVHNYAQLVNEYMQRYEGVFVNVPHRVLIFYVEDVPLEYSIYMQPAGYGMERGQAFRNKWEWLDVDKQVKIMKCKSEMDINTSIVNCDEYDTVFIQFQSGRVELLKN